MAGDDPLRVLQYLVSEATLKARVAGVEGEELDTTSGTSQGDALLPTLLAVYLEWVVRTHREKYPSRGVAEGFTLQYAGDMKMLLHARDAQQGRGPHAEVCV